MLPVPRQDFLAFGEEGERHTGLFSTVPTMRSGMGRIESFRLGLSDGQITCLAAVKHIARTCAVGKGVFIADADAIADLPALVVKLGVDECASEGCGE